MRPLRAFTFIELILAIFLFSYGIISVVQILPVNRRFLEQSTFQTQASFLAQEQMEKVATVSYDDLTTGAYEPSAALAATIGDGYVVQFTRSTAVSLIDSAYASTATDIGLKKVIVTVGWTERSGARNYTLTTIVHN
jgi:Tfp pilus assembly protein PilV